jgi:hypothetical protein
MFLGSKVRPVRRANNLPAICEPILYTAWDYHTTLYTSTTSYGDSPDASTEHVRMYELDE